jgi:signal transduction histidine kinase
VHARALRFRNSRIDPSRLDAVVAAVLTVALELETWLGGNAQGHRIALALLGPLFTLGVAIRRRYPTALGVGALVLGVVMQAAWPSAELSFGIAWMCNVYAVTVWSPPLSFAVGLAAYVAAAVAAIPFDKGGAKHSVPFIVISTAVILLVRRVLGDRERRAQLAERERDLAAREAVVEERARIARELHDAIAHNVSMMVVQAGAERRVLEASEGSTPEVLATIERIGRGALTEMRRLVGMLRSDTADELAPQPGLGDLSTLAAQVREAGLPVELRVEGERRELPVGIELSAYRIVQEALTNALKHAGRAQATVQVRYGRDSLELEIVDDGAGAAAPVSSGGHGLVGIRERVALYGGRLDAGRRPSGGFAVRVLLPIR